MKNIVYKSFVAAAFLMLLQSASFCQQVHILKGNEYFDRYAYSEAISEYEAALRKKPELTEVKIKLAECYRLTGGSDKLPTGICKLSIQRTGGLSLHELAVLFFLFVTAPVTAHLLAKAARHRQASGRAKEPPTSAEDERPAGP